MSRYNVDFKRLALLLLPTFLRRPLMAAVALAAASPLTYIHARFMRFRGEVNYRLSHNGQVCYLRAVINDAFDPLERRITISEDPLTPTGSIIYMREVDSPTMLPLREVGDALIINRRGFGGASGVDFWINIHAALAVDTDRLRAIVGAYKLASKRFNINYI